MKKTIFTSLVILTVSLSQNALALTPSQSTGSGLILSGESLKESGPASLLFLPVMASFVGVSVVADSLAILSEIGSSISVSKVEKTNTQTIVYGKTTNIKTNQPVDVKFNVNNAVAEKANIQPGHDVNLKKTPMGTLVTYEDKTLGFAAGTDNKNNLKSESF